MRSRSILAAALVIAAIFWGPAHTVRADTCTYYSGRIGVWTTGFNLCDLPMSWDAYYDANTSSRPASPDWVLEESYATNQHICGTVDAMLYDWLISPSLAWTSNTDWDGIYGDDYETAYVESGWSGSVWRCTAVNSTSCLSDPRSNSLSEWNYVGPLSGCTFPSCGMSMTDPYTDNWAIILNGGGGSFAAERVECQ